MRQAELSALTRRFFVRFLADLGVPSDEVATQIRRYFPDVREGDEALDLAAIANDQIDDATRSYFISLMFDCAMADPDAKDEIMLVAAKTAKSIGAGDLFVAALKRDLKWTKAAADKLVTQAAKAA